MGRKLITGKGAYLWEGSFSVGREPLTGKIFTVRRELPSRKDVFQLKVRFPVNGSLVVRVLPSGKRAS